MLQDGLSVRSIARRERVHPVDVRFVLRHACPPLVAVPRPWPARLFS